MLVETLIENSFQAVIAVDAVQACCVVCPWDMAEAESVGEGQPDRRKIGDVACSDPVVEDIDWLRE
jgi:hypothetical protein